MATNRPYDLETELERLEETNAKLLEGIKALLDTYDIGQRAPANSAIGKGRKLLREYEVKK